MFRVRARAFDRECDSVGGDGRDGKVVGRGQARARGVVRAEHVVHVDRVEFAVLEFNLQRQRFVLMFGNGETVVHHLAGAGRNLMIVERRENVLRIAAVNTIAVAIQHVNVHEVRPGIDFIV